MCQKTEYEEKDTLKEQEILVLTPSSLFHSWCFLLRKFYLPKKDDFISHDKFY